MRSMQPAGTTLREVFFTAATSGAQMRKLVRCPVTPNDAVGRLSEAFCAALTLPVVMLQHWDAWPS
jgi:hypothetical protein